MDGVALHAERQALDQRRPAALARLLDRALRLAVDGEHVGAVDDDTLEAVGGGAIGHVLGRVLEMRRRRVRPLVVVADEDHREPAGAGERHRLVRVAARGGALAEPADRDALLLADPERERAADRDRQHRRQVADHRDQAEVRVGHVDVAVPALRRPVHATHVLGEDAPRLDAARDVDAHVAVERRADVLGAHRRRDADGGTLVAAARVERARDLPLPVEDVPAFLDPARDEQVAVDLEQVLTVEAPLLHLLQRAAWLGHARDRHCRRTVTRSAIVSPWARPRTGCARSAARCSATGRRSACAAAARRWFEEFEAEIPSECPTCGGEMLHRCPACAAPFSSTFAVDCEECGAKLREPELFGVPIRRQEEPLVAAARRSFVRRC